MAQNLKKEVKETFSNELPGPNLSRQLHQEPFKDRQQELEQKYPGDFSQGARGFEEQPPYNPERKTLNDRLADAKATLSKGKDKLKTVLTGEHD